MGEQGLTPGLPRAREGSTNMYLNPKGEGVVTASCMGLWEEEVSRGPHTNMEKP